MQQANHVMKLSLIGACMRSIMPCDMPCVHVYGHIHIFSSICMHPNTCMYVHTVHACGCMYTMSKMYPHNNDIEANTVHHMLLTCILQAKLSL